MAMKAVTATESLWGVIQQVTGVSKTGRNENQRYNFRGIDAVMNAVGPALRNVGGFITHKVLDYSYEHGLSANGKPTVDTRVKVRYSWYGTDGGEPIVSEIVAEATDTADKSTAKAMSVAYRTYLIQILCLPTDEKDPDEDYIERGVSAAPKEPVQVVKDVMGAAQVATEDWITKARDCKTIEELRALYKSVEAAGELKLPVKAGGPIVDTVLREIKAGMAAPASEYLERRAEAPVTQLEWPVAPVGGGDDAA